LKEEPLHTVAMGDLDGVDLGRIERLGDRLTWSRLYWWRMACMPSRR
jgi:hypothetical protein